MKNTNSLPDLPKIKFKKKMKKYKIRERKYSNF